MESIVVTSGVGGAGKSLVIAGLALALSQLGRRTGVIETGRRTMDILLDVHPVYDAKDLLSGQCSFEESAVSVEENLLVTSGGVSHGKSPQPSSEQRVPAALRCLRQLGHSGELDYLIWEIPRQEQALLEALAPKSTLTLLVCAPNAPCARENRSLSDLLYRCGVEMPGLYVTPLPSAFLRHRPIPHIDWLIDQVCARLWGILPHSEILVSSGGLLPHFRHFPQIYYPFCNLAERIMGKYIDLWVS